MEDYRARNYYRGSVAERYLSARQLTTQWRREQEVVGDLIAAFERGSEILDVPFGTGRFLDQYTLAGLRVYGVDISWDMLNTAKKVYSRRLWRWGELIIGDAQDLPLSDNSVDYAVCVRFANWLPLPTLSKVVRELKRVVRKAIILETHERQSMSLLRMSWKLSFELAREPSRICRGVSRRLESRSVDSGVAPKGSGGFTRAREGPSYFLHAVRDVRRIFEDKELVVARTYPILRRTSFADRELRDISIHVLEPPK